MSSGATAFTAGKFDATVRQMTAVLQGDKVDPNEAAKALYYRGLAYQKLKQHTRAIADLGAAMWLGLPRIGAHRGAGQPQPCLPRRRPRRARPTPSLPPPGRAPAAAMSTGSLPATAARARADTASISGFATEVRTEDGRKTTIASASPAPTAAPPRNAEAASPGSWATTQQSEAAASEQPSGGNRLSRWWGSVRGSSNEAEPAPAPAPASSAKCRFRAVGLDDADPS